VFLAIPGWRRSEEAGTAVELAVRVSSKVDFRRVFAVVCFIDGVE
jgi:hypothetical protein